jgi:antitoxin (DNA-binding transcriptional repressor) of toxin-antitoxin stability system
MDEIAIYDAAMRFSEIAKRVKETGQAVRITNLGEEIVDITPISPRSSNVRSKEQAFEALSLMRRHLPKTSHEQIKADIAEGRH